MHDLFEPESDEESSEGESEHTIFVRESTTKTPKEVTDDSCLIFSLKRPTSHGGPRWNTYHYHDDGVYVLGYNNVWYVGDLKKVAQHALHVDENYDQYEFQWLKDREFIEKISKVNNPTINVRSKTSSDVSVGSKSTNGSNGTRKGVSSRSAVKGTSRSTRAKRIGGRRSHYSTRRVHSETAGSSDDYDDIEEPLVGDLT